MNSVVIRPLAPNDSLEALTELLHSAYKELADIGLRYVATYQTAEVTAERASAGECYVAELDGRIVGTICFEDAATNSGCAWYDRPDVASLHQFAVEPGLQRSGIGSALLDKVESRAVETGAAEIALDTAEPATHLIELYSRRGYRVVETVQWDVTNYRSVIMSKHLG